MTSRAADSSRSPDRRPARESGGALRISVDTGGTFTDVVVSDQERSLASAKAPTRVGRTWEAIKEALEILSADAHVTVRDLIARCATLSYATTVATNAILTDSAPMTAFVTTEGFPDILTLRQGGRQDPFDFATSFPRPYIPRSLTFELPGRISAEGNELKAFDSAAALAICRRIGEAGCRGAAVCLLWAHANPAHELAFRAVMREYDPSIYVTLSHELNPVIREYPRASSSAIDASLKPLVQEHLAALERDLATAGFRGELLVVTSAGGCLPALGVIEKPIYSVDSGPSVAPVAARAYAAADANVSNVIVYDTGGTSFDVTLVRDGDIALTRDRWLGPEFTGDLLGIASVAVHSIGAGGGSVAWIDNGGLLRVGPQSAGAEPGPVCYQRGGTQPTVTDAALACGYLDPDYFLGGRLRLDEDAAHRAIQAQIAGPLGLTVEAAARAVLAVADQAMVGAIQEITVNQGVDPRECLLVAGGGAGGFNAVSLARELCCRLVLVPRAAGTLSAVGAQLADLVAEFTQSAPMSTVEFDTSRARETLLHLDHKLGGFVAGLSAGSLANAVIDRRFAVEGRYPDQVFDLRVPVPFADGCLEANAAEDIASSFHDLHHRTFAVSDDTAPVECQQWIGTVTVGLPKPGLNVRLGGERAGFERVRRAWFDGVATETRVIAGSRLAAGDVVVGPAIVEEVTSTVVLPPGAAAEVTSVGSYLITV
jgi:N-methylhydantoinase A